jgi:DNA-binding XRE family transcriptional regulator
VTDVFQVVQPMRRQLSFGELLRCTRIQRGLIATEVAERVGVSVGAIYDWEKDRYPPKWTNFVPLCSALNLPFEETRKLAGGNLAL